jgi:hypothetical protein
MQIQSLSPTISAPVVSFSQLALAGGVLWCVALPFFWTQWAVALLLLAVLAVVPLGLGLAATPERRDANPHGWQLALELALPAGLLLVAAFALPSGAWAAGLALPWSAFTGLCAWLGLAHLRQGRRNLGEFCGDVGLIYLAVGGAWAVLSRAGINPLGLSDLIVLATAVHFHCAGFALPLLAGLAAQALPNGISRWAAVGVVTGVPLVAAGITLSTFGVRLPEGVAAWFLAAATLLVAGLHLRLAARPGRLLRRTLFCISGLSLLAGMVLAAAYALGEYAGFHWLDVDTMVVTHGVVNALGFALPGLAAWHWNE